MRIKVFVVSRTDTVRRVVLPHREPQL